MKDLLAQITPPEGVRRVEHDGKCDFNFVTHDEGRELFDCDGDELEIEVNTFSKLIINFAYC